MRRTVGYLGLVIAGATAGTVLVGSPEPESSSDDDPPAIHAADSTPATLPGPPTTTTPVSSVPGSGSQVDVLEEDDPPPATTVQLVNPELPDIGPGALATTTAPAPDDGHGHDQGSGEGDGNGGRIDVDDVAAQFTVAALSDRYDTPAEYRAAGIGRWAAADVVDQLPAMNARDRAATTVRNATIIELTSRRSRGERWTVAVTATITEYRAGATSERTVTLRLEVEPTITGFQVTAVTRT